MADAGDPAHAASRWERDTCLRDGGVLVSTDYVIDETLTVIRVRLGLRAAARWWAQIDASSRVRWEWIDPLRAERHGVGSLSGATRNSRLLIAPASSS